MESTQLVTSKRVITILVPCPLTYKIARKISQKDFNSWQRMDLRRASGSKWLLSLPPLRTIHVAGTPNDAVRHHATARTPQRDFPLGHLCQQSGPRHTIRSALPVYRALAIQLCCRLIVVIVLLGPIPGKMVEWYSVHYCGVYRDSLFYCFDYGNGLDKMVGR